MTKIDSLHQLTIAKPCNAGWDSMTGNDRVRHCDLCNLNVYNIVAMSTAEAMALVESTDGRLCARLYKRKDGTVLTADCPVGVRAAWNRVAFLSSGALVILLTLSSILSARLTGSSGAPSTFSECERAAQDFLVKHLPDWMIPESWKRAQFVPIGGAISADPSIFWPPKPASK